MTEQSEKQNLFTKQVAAMAVAPAPAPAPMSELERLKDSHGKLLAQRQDQLLKATSAHQIERVRMVEHYRAKMQKVASEGEAVLRVLDRQFKLNADQIAHEIDELYAMRDAAEGAGP